MNEITKSLAILSENEFKTWLKSWCEDYWAVIPSVSRDIFNTKLAIHMGRAKFSSFIMAIMKLRFKNYEVEVDEVTVLLLSSLVASPGEAVMLSVAITHELKKKNQKVLDIEVIRDICEYKNIWLLPKNEMWEAQKGDNHDCECDNLLDTILKEHF